jgi:hypothetical protein
MTPLERGWLFPLKTIDYKEVLLDLGLDRLDPAGRERAEAALRQSVDYWPIPLFPMSCHLLCLEPILDVVRRGYPDVAEAFARKSIAENPKYDLLHFVLGAALAAQRDMAGASAEFQTAYQCHAPLRTVVGPFVTALCVDKDPAKSYAEAERLKHYGFFLAPPLFRVVQQAFPDYSGPVPDADSPLHP